MAMLQVVVNIHQVIYWNSHSLDSILCTQISMLANVPNTEYITDSSASPCFSYHDIAVVTSKASAVTPRDI